jgi:hypothetical protein
MSGIWTMVVRGDKSPVRYEIRFEVINPADPDWVNEGVAPSNPVGTLPDTPVVAVDPATGMPGERFAFYALGYPSRETVYYHAVAPDGTRYESSKYETLSNTEGRADWTWKAPEDAIAGQWMMVAVGDKSLLRREIPFTIAGH